MPVSIRQSLDVDPLKPELIKKSAKRRASLKAVATTADLPITTASSLIGDLHFEMIAASNLKLPARTLRKVDPENVKAVEKSIERYSMSRPILVDNEGSVIDGVTVVLAARNLGMEKIPCIRVAHLGSSEVRALRIAINRLGAKRQWDLDELRIELQELAIEDQPIEILGFSAIELDGILIEPQELEAPVEDPQEEPTQIVTVAGDVWELGKHRLLCGDAKAAESYHLLLGEERAQLALTDPPYAVDVGKVVSTKHADFLEGGANTSQADFEHIIASSFTQMRDHLVNGGMLMSFMDWKHASDLVVLGKKLGFEHLNIITWVKNQGGMGSLYRSQSEFVVALKTPGKHKNNVALGKNGRDRSNVWHYAGAGTRGTDAQKMLAHHPTPKPVQMLVDAILDVTDRGDIVLDPFGGSGSTLIAAHKADRAARLIELSPAYCDLIIRRWQEESGEEARRLADGATFAEAAPSHMSEVSHAAR